MKRNKLIFSALLCLSLGNAYAQGGLIKGNQNQNPQPAAPAKGKSLPGDNKATPSQQKDRPLHRWPNRPLPRCPMPPSSLP
jgi:hypothetical protein